MSLPTLLRVRTATREDIPGIMGMVDHSRTIMRQTGNTVQWVGYPSEEQIAGDIGQGIGHIISCQGRAVGYFALLRTPEPTYSRLDGGLWLDDTTPYGTIHRLARAPHSHGIARCAFAWSETQVPSVRVDTHFSNSIMLHLIEEMGYCRCGVVYMGDGSPREAFQKMTYPMVSADLKTYVEQNILPQYAHFDSAHRSDHILRVMAQSMELSRHYPEVCRDMVYTVAAYHDIGMAAGRECHHTASGSAVRDDRRLRQWFSPKQIETMAQAVEDHRASSGQPPRSIYGKIVAEADRDIEPYGIIRRTVQYSLALYPAGDKDFHWHRTLRHLEEKYGEQGYLQLYIPQSRNNDQLARLRRLMESPEATRILFDRIFAEETAPHAQWGNNKIQQ